jgi:hypothetical protein
MTNLVKLSVVSIMVILLICLLMVLFESPKEIIHVGASSPSEFNIDFLNL